MNQLPTFIGNPTNIEKQQLIEDYAKHGYVLMFVKLDQLEVYLPETRKSIGDLNYLIEAAEDIKASIAKNGLLNPLLVTITNRFDHDDNRRFIIIDGIMRYKALQELGITYSIPVIVKNLLHCQ